MFILHKIPKINTNRNKSRNWINILYMKVEKIYRENVDQYQSLENNESDKSGFVFSDLKKKIQW